MAFDSTAGLLFKIGADSEEATENIARFRALLGKDLGAMQAEFKEFSHEVLGSLSTVTGAVTAGVAVLAAAVVAGAAFAVEASHKYVEFAEEVEKGSIRTGISAENMSRLIFVAKELGVSTESLIGGLTKYSSYIVKSASDTGYQTSEFKKLGISQEDVKKGEEDMFGLLLQNMTALHGLGSETQKTAALRTEFGRGGADLAKMLEMDGAAFLKLAQRADELGIVLSKHDTEAALKFKIALAELKTTQEAIDVAIGQKTLPALTLLKELMGGLKVAAFDLRTALDFLLLGQGGWGDFVNRVALETKKIRDHVKEMVELTEGSGHNNLLDPKDTAKATADFTGLTNLVESLVMKTAGAGNEFTKAAAEIHHMTLEAAKAEENFEKLKQSGTLSAEAIKREAAALAKLPAGLEALTVALATKINENILAAGDALRLKLNAQREKTLEEKLAAWDLEMAKDKDQRQKAGTFDLDNQALWAETLKLGTKKILDEHAAMVLAANEDLDGRINAQREHGWQEQLAAFDIELEKLKAHYAKKQDLTIDEAAKLEVKLAAFEEAGHNKLLKANQDAWGKEILSLQSSLAAMISARLSGAERIKFIYDGDVAKFSAAEEEKTVALYQGEVLKAGIRALFAMHREELLRKEQNDLQALKNSEGWQGVFGSQFGQMLKGNEAAIREWATSTNQALTMVRLSGTALNTTLQDAFGNFSNAMGSGIAQAIVYSSSIAVAMRAAAASTLESLAAKSLSEAIYASALGFLRLAEYDPAGASAAFQSAALFGSIGLASAVAGRAIAPPQGATGSAAGTSGASSAPSSNQSVLPTNSAAVSTDRSRVTLNVYGPVIGLDGAEQLASILNDAVAHRDVRLIATQVKQATRATV